MAFLYLFAIPSALFATAILIQQGGQKRAEAHVPTILKFHNSSLTPAEVSVMNGMAIQRQDRGKVVFSNDNFTAEGEITQGMKSQGFDHGNLSISMDDGRVEHAKWIAVDASNDGDADDEIISAFEELHENLRRVRTDRALDILKTLEGIDGE